jgi:ubiquinone biosynthesis protein Coq4
MIPYHETHDIFHVLFNVGTSSEQEGTLQFILLGNGKITLYSFGTAMMSIILFPEYIKTYLKAFRIGKRCRAFYHLPYQKLLETHFQTVVKAIGIPTSIHHRNTFWNHKTL